MSAPWYYLLVKGQVTTTLGELSLEFELSEAELTAELDEARMHPMGPAAMRTDIYFGQSEANVALVIFVDADGTVTFCEGHLGKASQDLATIKRQVSEFRAASESAGYTALICETRSDPREVQ